MEGVVASTPPVAAPDGPGQLSLTTSRAARVGLMDGSGNDVSSSNPLPVSSSGAAVAVGLIVTPSANFTRPADTTTYAVGDLVANSTTAASVVPLSWTAARVAAGSFYVRRLRLKKSTTSTTAALFRVHLYSSNPSASSGIVNGDNGAYSTAATGYVGGFDIQVARTFSDGSMGFGVPIVGAEVNVALASGTTIWGLIECLGTYAPGSGEVFTVTLEVQQN